MTSQRRSGLANKFHVASKCLDSYSSLIPNLRPHYVHSGGYSGLASNLRPRIYQSSVLVNIEFTEKFR